MYCIAVLLVPIGQCNVVLGAGTLVLNVIAAGHICVQGSCTSHYYLHPPLGSLYTVGVRWVCAALYGFPGRREPQAAQAAPRVHASRRPS